ncbi:hypothetical protein [Terrabacter sp. Ter38]|uniref:hypothetical protein n=1 Tax=Terrabacter sp. Ter38 TaxID=2926030 RepID=UPI002117EB83|nr:hypothetical protein [Terrabacter sp. Ter38]
MSDFHPSDVLAVIEQQRAQAAAEEFVAQEKQHDRQVAAERLQDQAAQTSWRLADEAEDLRGEASQIADEVRLIAREAKAGRITKDEAVKRLTAARERYNGIVGAYKSLASQATANQAVLADPRAAWTSCTASTPR